MSPTLTIMRGISGSGKSTVAKTLPGVKVSRDSIRLAFFGSDGQDYYKRPSSEVRKDEDAVSKIHEAAITSLLFAGRDVVVDNTHIEWKYVKELANLGHFLGAEIKVMLIDTPLEEALANNFNRARNGGRYVPESAIRKQYQRLQLTKHFKVGY